MNNKVLVNLYIPFLEKKYEVFLPANKKIGEINKDYDFSEGA